MGSIVVGYVPKPEGRAALDQAVLEARLRDAEIVVVLSRRSAADHSGAEEEQSEVESILAGTGIRFEVRPLATAFDPAEDLITVAAEKRAELIVIGLRRRSPVGKLVLGSNSQRILLDAPCPVLAVKPDHQGGAPQH